MKKTRSIPLFPAGAKNKAIAQPSVGEAREILGKKKVFTSNEVAKVWGRKKINEESVPLRIETLESCAAKNAAGKAKWRLVYDLGQSMTGMFSERGEGNSGQPCFHPTHSYYPGSFRELNHIHLYYADVSPWIAKGREAGYRLIDFTPRFQKISFADQEKRIRKLGKNFFRTSAPVFAETVMSIFMISKIRMAENWHHWAPEKHMYGGYYVAIGRNIPHGLVIMPGYEGAGHGVAISRENDLE